MNARTANKCLEALRVLYFADVLQDSEDKKIKARINKKAKEDGVIIKDINGNVVND